MPSTDSRPAGAEANPRGADVNLRARAQQLEYRAIVERVSADGPGHVLDWGCGWGQMTHLLRERGVPTSAFDYRDDIDADGVRALEHFPAVEAYLSTDPVALPYADGSFDAVLSCGVLEHVQHPEASLGELRRVLCPGGRLYVFKLPNRFSYLEQLAKTAGWYYHGRLPHDRLYDLGTARSLAEAAGFEVLELRRANMLPLTLTTAAAQRFARGLWTANRALARVPGLNVLATNVELVARPCT